MLRPPDKYCRPERATKIMKLSRSMNQTVYIFGYCGAGKTSFIADYLQRHSYEYYSMAQKHLTPVELLELAKPRHAQRIVVLDDLHLVCGHEEREALLTACQILTRDRNVWLILLSRSPVPGYLKALYIDQMIVTFGQEALFLTKKEILRYLDLWGLHLPAAVFSYLCKISEGYPLFLRLAAIHLLANSGENHIARIDRAAKDLWDCLKSRTYDLWPVEIQDFLKDISVVSSFNLDMARHITQRNDAALLILSIQETSNCLETRMEGDHIIYRIPHAIRLFLRNLLQKYSIRDHIDDLLRRAGNAYELQENYSQALVMYEQYGDSGGISRILIRNARTHPGAGHYWELRKYYNVLTAEAICTSPDLMVGMSMLRSIQLNDEESEHWYQMLADYSKTQTGSARQDANAKLLYLDIALPHRGSVRMTDIICHAGAFITQNNLTLPGMSLTNNQPSTMNGGKDFCEWSRRDRELAVHMGMVLPVVMRDTGKGLVSLALAESLFEKGADDYEISMLAQKGRLQAMAGGKTDLVFVGVGLLAQLMLMKGCITDALDSLDSFQRTLGSDLPLLLRGVDTLRTRLMLYAGRSAEAIQWMETAPDEDAEFCTLERYRYITKVRCYLSLGKKDKALRLCQQLLLYAEKRNRTYLHMEAQILIAIAQYRLKDPAWPDTLQKAITRAEDYFFVRILTREGAALWDLLKSRRFVWANESFQRRVMKECAHMAQLYPGYLEKKAETEVTLSDKAIRILRLQADGRSIDQIAAEMYLSRAGVKYYNRETYKKLGVTNKAAAIVEARNRGIL